MTLCGVLCWQGCKINHEKRRISDVIKDEITKTTTAGCHKGMFYP
jgi:hypothetical protein